MPWKIISFLRRNHATNLQNTIQITPGTKPPKNIQNCKKIPKTILHPYFATFSDDAGQFSWQAQHFGRVHRHFAWQAQHFRRVVSRVFLQIELAGLRQVATRCRFRGRRGILCDVVKSDGGLDETSILRLQDLEVPAKIRRKMSILKLQSVKIGGSLEMLVFLHPRVLFRVSGFPVASPCLWGKLRTPHSTLYTPHSRRYTPQSTLYTFHSTLYTLHSTLPALHSTLHTPYFPLHTADW